MGFNLICYRFLLYVNVVDNIDGDVHTIQSNYVEKNASTSLSNPGLDDEHQISVVSTADGGHIRPNTNERSNSSKIDDGSCMGGSIEVDGLSQGKTAKMNL